MGAFNDSTGFAGDYESEAYGVDSFGFDDGDTGDTGIDDFTRDQNKREQQARDEYLAAEITGSPTFAPRAIPTVIDDTPYEFRGGDVGGYLDRQFGEGGMYSNAAAAQAMLRPISTPSVTPSVTPMVGGVPYKSGYVTPNYMDEAIRDFQTMTIPEATGYGGINISPYAPRSVTFAGGSSVLPTADITRNTPIRLNVGQAPSIEDPSFVDRLFGAFQDVPQRARMYGADTGQFTGPTLEKMDENRTADVIANILNPFKMITGVVDTADYMPLVGGEMYQYADPKGGLLDLVGLGDPTLMPYSDIGGGMAGGDSQDVLPLPAVMEPEEDEEEEIETPKVELSYTPSSRSSAARVPYDRQFARFDPRFYANPSLLT